MLLFVVVVLLFSLTNCLPANLTVCSQCSYHGACSSNSSCVCLPNWSGSNCANFTDPCSYPQSTLPCANNATCTASNIPSVISAQLNSSASNYSRPVQNFSWTSSYQCNCSSAHSGDRCELEYCDRAQCHNHGECLLDTAANNTFCNCNSQYNGTRCGDCIVCSAGTSLPCTNVNCNHGLCEKTSESYECSCSIGFTGTHCSSDIDECDTEPGICNYGSCINYIGSYYCDCTNSGYSGSKCNQELFECQSYPCKNGGTCAEVTGPGYQCGCLESWSGNTCETHVCDFSSTCVFGDCAHSPPPFTCTCDSGYQGVNCATESDECETVTCQNGGTCKDKVNAYICQCSQGYEGTHCESKIDYCVSNSCTHGLCVSLLSNYSCTCDAGYTGQHCEENIDNCSPDPCMNGSCVDGEDNFTCQCQEGYTGITCGENIDECSGDPCGEHASCTDLLNNFTCSCEVGYTGDVCDELIDYCSTVNCSDHGSCSPSNCTAVQCSSYTDFFSCTCDAGYTGYLCQEVVPHCASNNCSRGECVEETEGYSCRCSEGFSGEFCTFNESSCVDNVCENGSCVEYFPNYRCECYVGFEGESCETKINLCEDVSCLNGTCTEENGNASCECISGYYGEECQFEDLCYNHNCVNGNCSQVNSSSYSCFCEEEFSGLYCENSIHSCEYQKCENNATCVQTDHIGMCICTYGYTGELCEARLPECSSLPCMNHGVCTELATGYNCTCTVGYTGDRCEVELSHCPTHLCNSTSGLLCAQLDSSCFCSNNVSVASCAGSSICSSKACANNGVCGVYGDSSKCVCPENYTGENCQSLTDPCFSNPCNTGYCVAHSQNEFECVCLASATGRYCESMVLPCNETESCSLTGSKACIRNSTQETCYCHPAYTGEDCANQLDCPANLCLHVSCCVVLNGSFECSDSANTNCSSNPCDSKPCIHGNCTANGVSYTCNCPAGFTGQHCNAPIDFCAQVDCANGGTCENGTDLPVCNCKSSFYGELCLFESPGSEHLFDDCANSSCKYLFNNGNCDTNCAVKESCFYDGLDCLEIPTCPSSDCETIYGNKDCDKECNNERCLFDGGDCLPDYISYNQEFASGSLIIIVKSPRSSYSFNIYALPQILYRISKILRTIVMVEYVSELDRTSRVSRSAGTGYEYKYRISSRVENSLCRDYCFRTTDRVVDYLNAYLIESPIDTNEYTVLQITSSEETPQRDVWPIVAGVSFVAVVLVLVIGIGGIIIGKKRPRGMYFPRRLTSGTTSSERAALVGSRTETEDPDSICIQFASDSCKEYAAKRSKLHSSISSCASFSSDSRPPPYEYFHQSPPQACIPNSIFPPMQEHSATLPLTSIELDHLLVGSPCATYSLGAGMTPESINSRGIGGYSSLSLAVIIGNPTACGFLPFPALPTSRSVPCTSSSCHQPAPTSDLLSVEELIRLGADVNLSNDQGATPLHLAAMYSRSDVAGSLIAAGAKVNIQDRLGRAPLHSAVASGAKGVFHILLTNRNLNIDLQSLDGSTALMLGARHLHNDLVHEMLREDANASLLDKNRYTALHWAAAVDNAVAIQSLITHSADVNYQNCRGETPLFIAAKEGSAGCVMALLQNSASLQITDFLGRSPITIASERLHKDIEHILTSPPQASEQKMDPQPNPVNIISKGAANTKSTPNTTKTEHKRVKKFSSPGSKVHPISPISSINCNLSPAVEVKLEVPSPQHAPVIPITTVLPLYTDYSDSLSNLTDQIQDYDTLPINSKFQLVTHPYPTPPNIHSEFLKPPQQTSVSDAPFSTHYPSPESSQNTVSPPITSSSASYPNHSFNAKYTSSIRKSNLTEPDWDEFDCS